MTTTDNAAYVKAFGGGASWEKRAVFVRLNGKLYAEMLPLANFDRAMRETLLDCGSLDWSRISPAVFGSLFQSIMDSKARRNLGAHYTSERNILRVINPLCMDELRAELNKVKRNKKLLDVGLRGAGFASNGIAVYGRVAPAQDRDNSGKSKRVALVIGNGAYAHVTALPNCHATLGWRSCTLMTHLFGS